MIRIDDLSPSKLANTKTGPLNPIPKQEQQKTISLWKVAADFEIWN